MFKMHKEVLQWGGQELTIETGKMARQADGAVLVNLGDTTILATVVAEKTADESRGFFPLTVHYQEKKYAAGKIPGGFFKREGRPSEYEVLTSRLIDRPIRPLFPKTFKNEVQVICTVLSHDEDNDSSVVAMIAASAALAISGIPFLGPIGAARVGRIDNKFVLNPTPEDMESSDLDVVVAGTVEGILMVESQAQGLSEEVMLEAVLFGHKEFQSVIQAIASLKKAVGNAEWDVPALPEYYDNLQNEIRGTAENALRQAYKEQEKLARKEKIDAVKASVVEKYAERDDVSSSAVLNVFSGLEKEIVRTDMLKTKMRIDGRDMTTVRPIACDTGLLPRAHGCALFTRGETQALAVTTLGTPDDEQIMDTLGGEYKERFMLHYNFPPFSVGETGRFGSPGRREIGHGKLAWRALSPMLPARDDFPYTIRIVSEILESNGSSSMATVCGASLAMMDAGVPLKNHVAGIAMGLIKEGDDFVVLTDILGDEDHLGDMDFKVAGTRDGITALQMDIKITSINADIMKIALAQARDGRLHIIGEMEKSMNGAREGLSEFAPQIMVISIPVDKIRDVIGTGGKIIRELCEVTDTKISIEDDGKITISGVGQDKLDDAKARIMDLTAEAEVGGIYKGKVTKVTDFGAFVNFLSTFGLIHVSEMAKERVGQASDILSVGDEVSFKVVSVDDRGKLRLSMKALLDD